MPKVFLLAPFIEVIFDKKALFFLLSVLTNFLSQAIRVTIYRIGDLLVSGITMNSYLRMKLMKLLLTLVLFNFSLTALAKGAVYQLINGKPIVYLGKKEGLKTVKASNVPLKLRYKVKKFRIERTPSGPKISFEDVCEKDSSVEVRDMTGGGLMQEEIFGNCPAKWMGKDVLVVLSGMVYDNIISDFSDEPREYKRNFFSHLSVEGTIGAFGLGDFNLDNTKTINFGHWVSDLSLDPRYSSLSPLQAREGFTASLRYEQ